MSDSQLPPSFNPPPPDRRSAVADAKAAKARAKALRPWYKKKRFWLLAVIALGVIIGVASGGSKKPSPNAAATTTTLDPSSITPGSIGSGTTIPPTTVPPAPTTTTADPGVVLTISGTGIASTVTILDQGGESQHNDVPLPYTISLTDHPSLYGIDAQADSGSTATTISCSIGGDATPVDNSSSGPYAVVDCSGSSF